MALMACPRCATQIDAWPGAVAQCPNCGFSAVVPGQGQPAPVQSSSYAAPPAAWPTAEPATAATAPYGYASAPAGFQPAGGYAPSYPSAAYSGYGQRNNGLAVAAMVLGIVGIFPLYILGALLGPTAIIMGAVAQRQIKQDASQKGAGMAVAGIVTGIVALLIGIFVVIALIASIASSGSYCMRHPDAASCP